MSRAKPETERGYCPARQILGHPKVSNGWHAASPLVGGHSGKQTPWLAFELGPSPADCALQRPQTALINESTRDRSLEDWPALEKIHGESAEACFVLYLVPITYGARNILGMGMDEAKIAHLTMTQGIIGRMASNSLALKSLAATVTAAIIALAASQSEQGGVSSTVALMTLLPLAIFWFLDAYYLRIEKAYRGLFDAIRRGEGVEPFAMDYRPYKAGLVETLRIGVLNPVMGVYPALMILVFVIAKIVGAVHVGT